MIVTCEKCSARYKLDDAKVTSRGAKITCPRCRHVFVIFREEEQAAAPKRPEVLPSPATTVATPRQAAAPIAASAATARPPAPPSTLPPTRDVHGLDFRKVGIASWKVKVRIGLIYDFSDYKTLRKYIQDGRVTAADLLSHDGKTWKPIGDIPDLERYFIDVYEMAEAQRAAAEQAHTAEANPFGDESPTNVVGMNDVAAGNLAFNLAQDEIDAIRSGPGGGRSATASLPPRNAPVGANRTQPPSGSSPRTLPPSGPATRTLPGLDEPRRSGRTLPPTGPGRTVAPGPAKPALTPGGIAGVVLILGAIGGWAYLNFFSTPDGSSDPGPADPGPAVAAPAADPVPPPAEDIREKVREELQRELEQGADEPAPVVERDQQLIPVKPKNLGTNTNRNVPLSSGTAGASTGAATNAPPSNAAAPASARDHADVGDDAWRRGDYSSAVSAYKEAVRLEPGSATYLGKLGRAQYKAGDKGGATQSLSSALRGGYKEADKWLGHIARDQGDVAGATGHYNDYLKTSPSDAAEIQRELDQLTGG